MFFNVKPKFSKHNDSLCLFLILVFGDKFDLVIFLGKLVKNGKNGKNQMPSIGYQINPIEKIKFFVCSLFFKKIVFLLLAVMV